jgi:hypothetical protein
VGLALYCPVTSQSKGYPFEVLLPQGLGIERAVLSDQVKSLDWRVRKARRIGRVPSDVPVSAYHASSGEGNMVVTFRPRALIAAVRDAWPAWLTLTGIIVAGILGWMLSTNASACIRYAGTVLQAFGLAMVAIGLSEVRRSFGKPSLLQRVLVWFGKIWAVFRPPKPIILEATAGAIGIATGRVRAVVAAQVLGLRWTSEWPSWRGTLLACKTNLMCNGTKSGRA